MPIWLLGCLSYYYSPTLRRGISWMLCGIFLVLAGVAVLMLPALPGELGKAPWFFSGQFLTDLLIGVFIAIALAIMPRGETKNAKLTGRTRKVADLTFPLYILHFPLLVLYDAVINSPISNTGELIVPTVAVLVACIILGLILEKYRKAWNTGFKKVVYDSPDVLRWLKRMYLQPRDL